jgi:hypothetical protein
MSSRQGFDNRRFLTALSKDAGRNDRREGAAKRLVATRHKQE